MCPYIVSEGCNSGLRRNKVTQVRKKSRYEIRYVSKACSSDYNYRLIALANVISKVFESLIILRCEQFLTTADNQFGFKSGHSTDFCIYTLKEFIEYYKQRNTTIFVTSLDASKAFDRIDHWLLLKKLIEKHVPLFIIRLLVCWYSTQKMHIRWGNTVTS